MLSQKLGKMKTGNSQNIKKISEKGFIEKIEKASNFSCFCRLAFLQNHLKTRSSMVVCKVQACCFVW